MGIAGTTETGSFDDLVGISKLGLKYGIHVHVDAAWGGPVTFSSHSHLLSGTFLSTSITVDGHKQFYTPLGCGMVFFKKGRGESIKTEAEYIIRKGSGDLGVKGLEGSRPAMILYLYANLKILGRKGLGKLIDMGIVRTREMYNRLRMFPGGVFECIHEPQSNILLYRYLPLKYRNSLIISKQDSEKVDWVNEQIQVLSKKSRDVDMIFTSRTRIIHKDLKITCLRVVISNPLTTFEIIEKGIRAQLRVAKVVERKFEVRELDLKWNGIEPVGFPWDI